MNYSHITFRNAKIEDCPALLKAEQQISLEPGQLIYVPHELKATSFCDKVIHLSDNPRGIYLVAELDGRVVGHGHLTPMTLETVQHVADLSLAVHTGHQGHGVGEKLIGKILDWARTCSQLEKIEAQIRATNTRAIALCTKAGFKEEGRWLRRIKIADDQYVDDILMGVWL